MAKVFLSHSSKDNPFVRLLKEDIEASKVDVWLAEVKILVGDSLIRKISAGIDAADYVIACLSHSSVGSNWVREELEIAATLGINGNRVMVLPLLLSDCEIPIFLRHLKYIDFKQPVQYDSAFRQLLERINPQSIPKTVYSYHALTIGGTREYRLVQAANAPEMNTWILDYLIGTISERSPKERHFSYLALGEIGGSRAEAAVEQGLLDPNAFARSGAEKAWRRLGH